MDTERARRSTVRQGEGIPGRVCCGDDQLGKRYFNDCASRTAKAMIQSSGVGRVIACEQVSVFITQYGPGEIYQTVCDIGRNYGNCCPGVDHSRGFRTGCCYGDGTRCGIFNGKRGQTTVIEVIALVIESGWIGRVVRSPVYLSVS